MTPTDNKNGKRTVYETAHTLFCGSTDEATGRRLHAPPERKHTQRRKDLDMLNIRLVM